MLVSIQVLYRQASKSTGMLFTTGKWYIDLPMHKDGDYIVEVRAYSEGGDGAVAQVRISGKTSIKYQHNTFTKMYEDPFRGRN